jgi:hypothetical protein
MGYFLATLGDRVGLLLMVDATACISATRSLGGTARRSLRGGVRGDRIWGRLGQVVSAVLELVQAGYRPVGSASDTTRPWSRAGYRPVGSASDTTRPWSRWTVTMWWLMIGLFKFKFDYLNTNLSFWIEKLAFYR